MADLAELLGFASGFALALGLTTTEPWTKLSAGIAGLVLVFAWRKVGKLAKRTSKEPHP
jgi:hypothetical protein